MSLLLCLGAGAPKSKGKNKELFILKNFIQLQYRLLIEWGLGAEQDFVLVVVDKTETEQKYLSQSSLSAKTISACR